jgi:site-specific recombinase
MDGWAGTAPDRDAFGKHFAPSAPKSRPMRELHALLSSAAAAGDSEARLQWLERAMVWLGRGKIAVDEHSVRSDSERTARLRLLVRVLEEVGTWRTEVAQLVAALLHESGAFHLLSRLGLPGDRSFLAETVDRISRRLLPSARDERDLAQVLARLLPRRKDAEWIAGLDAELCARLTAALDDGSTWKPVAHATADAALLLATRISALGLSDDIRVRSPRVPLRESPLFRLPRAADALLALAESEAPPPEALAHASDELTLLLHESQRTVRAVTRNLEQFGVSVDVVYRLEVMTKSMARLELLLDQLIPKSAVERAAAATRLLSRLLEDRLRDRSTLDLARTNLHLLARKIIERAGHTGEHYITSSRREYVKMLLSAGGGGVLTAGTAALKFLIGWAHLAPFAEGMLSACNYAGSFIVMQLLGFTLATKQPSMTAAALAGTLRESAGHTDLTALVAMIGRITRSQLAAAIGNIGMVIPAALAFDHVWRTRHGAPFLDPETAEYVLHSLHPAQSGTIFYAALTGVLLWSSSIAAGWLENWAAYRRLPEAIAEHRYGRFLGRGTMRWLSGFLRRNIAGFGGNSTLGFFLAMTPVMGKFFGLPLDVRHVTLSTGALTLSVCAVGFSSEASAGIYPAILGIAIIGCLNFGVSFLLALAVALRAREAKRSDRLRLILSVLATFFRSPLQFFIPPARDDSTPVHGPVSVAPPPAH